MAWIDPSAVAQGEVLTSAKWNQDVVANTIALRAPAGCKVRRDATQSIPTNTQRLINWDAEIFDTDGMFTASSVTITINTAGIYLVQATVRYPTNATSTRAGAIVRNATISGSGDSAEVTAGVRIGVSYFDRSPDTQSAASVTAVESLDVADTISVIAYQNSGVALDTGAQTTIEPTTCSVIWLGQVS